MDESSPLWAAVDKLIDRAPSLGALRANRIHLLAARRWRILGRPVPPDLVREEALAAVRAVLAHTLLDRVRTAYDGEIVILKGPEVAALYPDATTRTYIDLDLLVADAEGAQTALLANGFEEVEDPPWAFRRDVRDDLFSDKHHSRPLQAPDIPLRVELHNRPSWPRWLTPPRGQLLLDVASASTFAPDAALTLPRAYHAVVLAAHSWVHEPLGRVRDLLDVAAMSEGVDRRSLDEAAAALGAEHLWRTTIAAAEALFGVSSPTLPLRTWARNVRAARERTVFESHLEGWFSCFWTSPPNEAFRLAAENVLWDLRPAAGEPWREKIRRAWTASRNARVPKSQHDARLGREARQFSPSRRWRRPPTPRE